MLYQPTTYPTATFTQENQHTTHRTSLPHCVLHHCGGAQEVNQHDTRVGVIHYLMGDDPTSRGKILSDVMIRCQLENNTLPCCPSHSDERHLSHT